MGFHGLILIPYCQHGVRYNRTVVPNGVICGPNDEPYDKLTITLPTPQRKTMKLWQVRTFVTILHGKLLVVG